MLDAPKIVIEESDREFTTAAIASTQEIFSKEGFSVALTTFFSLVMF
ncbi:MAG: hypothetical protein AAFO84_02995 [Cyanobacteria bacterium J06598_1]